MPLSYTNAASFDRSGSGSYNCDLVVPAGLVANASAVLVFMGAIGGQVSGGGTYFPSSDSGLFTNEIVWLDPSSNETLLTSIFFGGIGSGTDQGTGAIAVGLNYTGATSLGLANGGTLRLRGEALLSASGISAALAVGLWDVSNANPFTFFDGRSTGGNPSSGLSGTADFTTHLVSRTVDSALGYGAGVASTSSGGSYSYSDDGWENYVSVSHTGSYGTVHVELVKSTGVLTDSVPYSLSSSNFETGFTQLGVLAAPGGGGVRRRGMVIG